MKLQNVKVLDDSILMTQEQIDAQKSVLVEVYSHLTYNYYAN